MSQKDRLLEAFAGGAQLTVLDAIKAYGCYALSQRCGELIRAGYPIHSEMVTLANGKRVARYSLRGQAELAL